MFRLSDYPQAAQTAFAGVPITWGNAVLAAIEGGFTDLEDLTDLAFFMHHKERLAAGTAKPLSTSEPHFQELAAEWKAWQTVIQSILNAPPDDSGDDPPPADTSWRVSKAALVDLADIGGPKLVEWAKTPPAGKQESREFAVAPRHQDTFETIFVWKSRNPNTTCVAAPNKHIQYAMMLHDDIEFWRERMPSEIQAQIRQASQASATRAYRLHIIENGLCPQSAKVKEIEDGRALILMMIPPLLGLIPVPGLKSSKTVNSVGELIKSVAGLFG
jgi:hypothetical protein